MPWLALTTFFSCRALAEDFGMLVDLGGVSQNAREAGSDHPAGWFRIAAKSYPPCDELNRLANRTCELVSLHLVGASVQ